MNPVFLAALLALASGLFPSRRAAADDATEARFHFQRGVDLFKDGKTELALEQFLTSGRLVKNPNAVFNAAKCFEKLARYNEAFALYSEYLAFDLEEKERSEGEVRLGAVEKKVAVIFVRSRPGGAEIFLDRKELGSWGRTPREIAVPAGPHEVIVAIEGCHPTSVSIEAVVGERRQVSVDLEPRAGKVRFQGPYRKAAVTIDGNERREVELPGEIDLPVGRHMVKIEVHGYIPEEKIVEVAEGRTAQLDFILAPVPPPTGSLNIVSTPSSALVRLDEEEFGFTPLVKTTSAGRHSIIVGMDGMQSWKGDFNLEEKKSLFLAVDLVPEGIPRKKKRWQYALWTAGGVFIVGGGVAGALALKKHDEFEENPTERLRAEGVVLGLITDGLFVLGTICLLAGTVWYAMAKRTARMKSKGDFSVKEAALKGE